MMMGLVKSRAGRRLCASLLAGAALVLTTLLPSAAAAQSTFTTQSVNLRAGPDRSFPLVTWFPPRTQVRVLGCTAGWRWCDVSARGSRGWVSSRYLANVPRGRTPVVSFSVGPYWDSHFRNRPWYASRPSWEHWGTPGFRPPPPPPGRPPSSRPPRPPSNAPGRPLPSF